MVLELAAESVERKCEMLSSVIVGNYEFYYAAGKFAAAWENAGNAAFGADENTPPEQMKETVMECMKDFTPADEEQAYLLRMLERYRPGEVFDEQTSRLFLMGRNA